MQIFYTVFALAATFVVIEAAPGEDGKNSEGVEQAVQDKGCSRSSYRAGPEATALNDEKQKCFDQCFGSHPLVDNQISEEWRSCTAPCRKKWEEEYFSLPMKTFDENGKEVDPSDSCPEPK